MKQRKKYVFRNKWVYSRYYHKQKTVITVNSPHTSAPTLPQVTMFRHPFSKAVGSIHISIFYAMCASSTHFQINVRKGFYFILFYFGKLGPLSPRRRVLFPQTSSPIRVSVSDGWFTSGWHGSFHSKPLADVRYMLCPSSTFLTV